jgi:hypothetical protein
MSPNNIYIIVSSVFVLVIGYDIYSWLRGRKITSPEIRLKLRREKLNYTILILGLTCLIASILFHVNIFEYRSPIEFKEIDAITLKDFKGYRLPSQTLHGEKRFAFITCSIDWMSNGKGLEVRSLFHPSRSYVYNENTIDKSLLQHELYHFRVTEVFARKSREQLSAAKAIPDEEEIKHVIDLNKLLESQMQHRYDDETYHGYVLKNQKMWQSKIDSLLSSLVQYEQTTIRHH